MAGDLASSGLNSIKGVTRNQVGRRVDVPPVAVPGQALTKFNRHPPKVIPRTADKGRFG